MRLAFFALAAAVGSLTVPAVAHPGGHDDEYRPQRRPITELAQEAVVKLVTQAKLPASWAKAPVAKMDIRVKGGAQQYVVTFRNAAIRNPAQRTLYVLMNPDGSFISANYRLI